MQRGRLPTRRLFAVVAGFVSAAPALVGGCSGSDASSHGGNGGAGGSGTCQDYVTPDGYTCCCGETTCKLSPGCSHGGAGSNDTDGGQSAAGGSAPVPFPAPHATLPQVVASGGPVMAHPRVVPIFLSGDSFQSRLEQLLSALPGSSYWAATTKEYGVGDIRVTPSVVVPETLPATISADDIDAWMVDHVEKLGPGWPSPTGDDLYTLFLPATTSVTSGAGQSCRDFGGYHFEGRRLDFVGAGDGGVEDGGAPIQPTFPYAVVAHCQFGSGLSEFDAVTMALSHELIEASTDPLVITNPAHQFVDDPHLAWQYAFTTEPESEVADLCQTEEKTAVLLGNFVVQRSWSNAAAASNHDDPCAPQPTTPYFGAAPDLDESITVGGTVTRGIQLSTGEAKTVNVRLFSTASTPAIHVTATEGPEGNPGSSLSFSWDRQDGVNGDVLQLTIQRLSDGPIGGASVVMVLATTDTTRRFPHGNAWLGLVAN